MSLNLSTRDSLLHGVSFNKKGKIIWTRSFEDLRMFVEEVLDLTDGVWGCPGEFAKQFKSENIDFRWYSDSQTITLSGKAKNEIGERLNSAAPYIGEAGKSKFKRRLENRQPCWREVYFFDFEF